MGVEVNGSLGCLPAGALTHVGDCVCRAAGCSAGGVASGVTGRFLSVGSGVVHPVELGSDVVCDVSGVWLTLFIIVTNLPIPGIKNM